MGAQPIQEAVLDLATGAVIQVAAALALARIPMLREVAAFSLPILMSDQPEQEHRRRINQSRQR